MGHPWALVDAGLVGDAQAVHCVGLGGDALDGEVGFVGVGGEHRGDAGDGVVVAADPPQDQRPLHAGARQPFEQSDWDGHQIRH